MTWNYRVFRHEHILKSKGWKSTWYGLHEVYYNDKGEPYTYAPEPEAVGDTVEDLVDSIALMLRDAKAHQKAMKEKKKHYLHGKTKTKMTLSKKDFEKGGVYFVNLLEFEKEISESTTLPIKLPSTTNAKADSKNPRRKPRSRNKQ